MVGVDSFGWSAGVLRVLSGQKILPLRSRRTAAEIAEDCVDDL